MTSAYVSHVFARLYHVTRIISATLCVVSLGTSLACGSDVTAPPVNALAQQYWSASLNHHAITLALAAPYNKLQLTLTPRTASGVPLAVGATVVYMASDTSVMVDSTGLLTAIAPETGVQVIAKMTIGGIRGVTLADTAVVNVNDTAPVPNFASLALTTEPGDSARWTIDQGSDRNGDFLRLDVSLLDSHGNNIPNANIKILSRNTVVVGEFLFPDYENVIQRSNVGQSWIVAEATVYGVTHSDSLLFTVLHSDHGFVYIYPRTPVGSVTPIGAFSPSDDTIQVGGSVAWQNNVGLPADVVFDNPSAVAPPDSAWYIDHSSRPVQLPREGGGNIPPFATCDSLCRMSGALDTIGWRARSFPVAGAYPYHSALYHTTGVIHVIKR